MKKCTKQVAGCLALFLIWMVVTARTGSASKANRSVAEYDVPKVTLVRDDGKNVALPDELDDGRPVVMNFIFTTCTSICPLLSQTFERLQDQLGPGREKVHIVSISIDPEEDTPARLAAYAKRYNAGPEWRHYTGTMEAIIATAKAFNVYRGDKMSHTPVTLVRKAPREAWVRFDGFATPDELMRELRSEVSGGRPPQSAK